MCLVDEADSAEKQAGRGITEKATLSVSKVEGEERIVLISRAEIKDAQTRSQKLCARESHSTPVRSLSTEIPPCAWHPKRSDDHSPVDAI